MTWVVLRGDVLTMPSSLSLTGSSGAGGVSLRPSAALHDGSMAVRTEWFLYPLSGSLLTCVLSTRTGSFAARREKWGAVITSPGSNQGSVSIFLCLAVLGLGNGVPRSCSILWERAAPATYVPRAAPRAPGVTPPGLLFLFDEVEQCESI